MTPKLDKIITAFCNRIGQSAVFTDSVLQDGDTLTALEVVSYINRAMFELFNKYWVLFQGDRGKFAALFPELIKSRTIAVTNTDSKTKYVIANPNLDFFAFIDGITAQSLYIKRLPSEIYNTVLSGKHAYYSPTNGDPAIIELNDTLFMFPINFVGSGLSTNITINIIALPLNPADGSFLIQNGNYDSPYNNHWNDEIVRLAEELYKQDRQRDS
jgi:hypothetical protein